MRPASSALGLRLGLFVLVGVLALIVLLRALLLGESHPLWVGALTALFLMILAARPFQNLSLSQRLLWLGLLSAVWLVLALSGAAAAYVSFGLIVLLMTELPVVWALVSVVLLTATSIGVGFLHPGGLAAMVIGSILGGVVGVVIGLGFRVLIEETDRRQLLIADLHHTRAELAEQERAAGEMAERQRLAREIHDTVAQGLSSIQMLLHAAESEGLLPGAREPVRLAREVAAAGLADTRRLISALAPADLTGRSLIDALGRVCARAPARGPQVRLAVEGDPVRLPMPIESALVRLTQGALSNVARHSGAVCAVVTLSYSPGKVRLDIVDDGKGFPVGLLADAEAPRFGLDSMRARVEELAGEWDLQSEPGYTAVSVTFPVTEIEPDEPGLAEGPSLPGLRRSLSTPQSAAIEEVRP